MEKTTLYLGLFFKLNFFKIFLFKFFYYFSESSLESRACWYFQIFIAFLLIIDSVIGFGLNLNVFM